MLSQSSHNGKIVEYIEIDAGLNPPVASELDSIQWLCEVTKTKSISCLKLIGDI